MYQKQEAARAATTIDADEIIMLTRYGQSRPGGRLGPKGTHRMTNRPWLLPTGLILASWLGGCDNAELQECFETRGENFHAQINWTNSMSKGNIRSTASDSYSHDHFTER